MQVFKRSVRNVPWSSKLWINYLLELEKKNSTEELLKGIFFKFEYQNLNYIY